MCKKGLLLAYAMAAISAGNSGFLDDADDTQKILPPPKARQPKGTTKFVYDDGFECYALNQKNADRKHTNFLKNK
jgi:hypothetical protein